MTENLCVGLSGDVMTSKAEKEYFDRILEQPWRKGMCHQCGNYQSHSLRWCKLCGDEFCKHNHSLIEVIEIMMRFKRGKNRPAYYAAVYKRKLERAGFSEKDFKNYILERLGEMK